MAMLTTAFDAGGHERDRPYVAVAGFVTTANEWTSFESAWAARLAAAGISEFHMTQYLHPRHRTLVRDLINITLRHVWQKFAVTVVVNHLSANLRDRFRLNAFSLAGRIIVGNATYWQMTQWPNSRLEYVFEDGDFGKGKLMDAMKRDGYPAPIFRPKRDRKTGKRGVVKGWLPLQAADILANRTYAAADDGPDDILREFDSLPELPRVVTLEDLAEVESFLAMQDDDPSWRGRFGPVI